jgi:hypothetical protein
MLCNIVLYQPNLPSLLNLKAYDDVALTVAQGLRQAGHDVQYTINSFMPSSDKYFLFGAHLMPFDLVSRFPKGTIAFNLEQYHGHLHMRQEDMSPGMRYFLQNFQIIEYSPYNMPFWEVTQPTITPKVLPVPYGDNLIIPGADNTEQDIDVLYYGSIGGERKLGFLMAAMGRHRIKPKIVLMQNIYGSERDHYIRRAKIVLSATGDRIFPEVRASYLLANSKAVISDIGETDLIDPFYRDNLVFATKDDIEDKLCELLTDHDLRQAYAARCHALMKTRDIASYIQAIL